MTLEQQKAIAAQQQRLAGAAPPTAQRVVSDPTYSQLMDAARRAHAAGNPAHARRFLQLAKAKRDGVEPPPREAAQTQAGGSPITIDIGGGRIVEFPDVATAQAYMQRQQLAQADQPAGFDMDQFRRDQMAQNIGFGKSAAFGAMQGATFGASDEAMGFINGLRSAATDWGEGGSVMDEDRGFLARARDRFNDGYQERRDEMREALDVGREEHPVAAYGGEIAGAIAAPGAALGAAKNASTAARMGRGAMAGAATGGIYGFNAGEGGVDQRIDSAQDTALIGGVLGGAAPLASSAFQRLWEGHLRRKAVNQMVRDAPSAEALKQQARGHYAQGTARGQIASRDEALELGAEMERTLRKKGALWPDGSLVANDPATRQAIDALQPMGTHGLQGSQVKPVREAVTRAAKQGDNHVGPALLNQFDEFVNARAPEFRHGDELWSRAKKVDQIEELIRGAEVEDTTNSLRTKFKTVGRKEIKGQLPNWTDDEIAAASRVVKGGPGERALRFAGSVAPSSAMSIFAGTTGPGLLGYALGGPTGAAIATGGTMLAGSLAKRGANSAQRRNAELAKALIASGGQRPPLNWTRYSGCSWIG